MTEGPTGTLAYHDSWGNVAIFYEECCDHWSHALRLHHVEGATMAVDLVLSDKELAYLEELYVPHALVGVMAQNTMSDAGKKHVWSVGDQKI